MNAFSNFDSGRSGSEGPWLQWTARGTQDGSVPAKSFFIRDADGKTPFDGFTAAGVVLDIDTMQTGWCYSSGATGEAPDWKMNASMSRFEKQPGDEYKEGFKIRCAIGGGKTASWDQAGAGVWNAFVALVPELEKQPSPGVLPLVRMTGTKSVQFKRGSTVEPVLEVVKWVPRPDCLKEGAAAGIATDTGTASAQQAASQQASVPADAEF